MSRRIVWGGGRTGGGGGDGDDERTLVPLACELGLVALAPVVDLGLVEVGGRVDLAPAGAGSADDGEDGGFDEGTRPSAVGDGGVLISFSSSGCWASLEDEGESTVMGE